MYHVSLYYVSCIPEFPSWIDLRLTRIPVKIFKLLLIQEFVQCLTELNLAKVQFKGFIHLSSENKIMLMLRSEIRIAKTFQKVLDIDSLKYELNLILFSLYYDLNLPWIIKKET